MLSIFTHLQVGISFFMADNKIILSFTSDEWSLLEGLSGKTCKARCMTSFIVSEMNKKIGKITFGGKDIEEEDLIKRFFDIPPDLYRVIIHLARLSGVKPSAYVTRYIIAPILFENSLVAGKKSSD